MGPSIVSVDTPSLVHADLSEFRRQWRIVLSRGDPPPGKRQGEFEVVETVLAMAGTLLVDYPSYGSISAHRAPTPVPELARLTHRPPTSIIAKMTNLFGLRSHGAKMDRPIGRYLASDRLALEDSYRRVLAAARAEGVDPDRLPDFLGIEHGGDVVLLGEDELTPSAVEVAMVDLLNQADEDRPTEAAAMGMVRIGQSRFARLVLDNCGRQCVFCGLSFDDGPAARMLLASHIKPWRDSNPRERVDVKNGLAACPTHDVAFDTGLLTVDSERYLTLSPRLTSAMARNEAAHAFFGRPPLRERIDFSTGAQHPRQKYLDWHRERVYQGSTP